MDNKKVSKIHASRPEYPHNLSSTSYIFNSIK